MDLTWEEPFLITNAIIDIDNHSAPLPWGDLINAFEKLGCKHLQIRSFGDKPLSFFSTILEQCENSRLVSIDMIIKYQSNFDTIALLDLCQAYPRIYSIHVHTTPPTATLTSEPTGNLFFVADAILSSNHCGQISPDYFTINITTFTEAQKYNTCLNRKISIDAEGYIRNCPSMKDHFGNIKDTNLHEALAHPHFKKYWFINKDQISGCKDCEFRYICTDCRAYIENPVDLYSKPLKCGYNPHTCEWEEWSTNPLKLKVFTKYANAKIIN